MSSADSIAAGVTREEWDWYQKNIVPMMQEQITNLSATSSIGANVADTQQAMTTAKESQARNLARYGGQLSSSQQTALTRAQSLGQSANMAGAANNTRLGLIDRKTQGLGNMLATIQGVSASAQSGLNNAASMAAQREGNNAALKAQQKAQNMQMLGTLGAAAIMFL